MSEKKIRVPLNERVNGEWTQFEAELFNLTSKAITTEYPELDKMNFLFSKRLSLTQHLLDEFDNYIFKAKQ